MAGHSLSGFDITQPADTMICNRQPRLILFAMQYMLFHDLFVMTNANLGAFFSRFIRSVSTSAVP